MSKKHHQISKNKRQIEREKQSRRQRHIVVFSTVLVVVLIVAIVAIVFQNQNQNQNNQTIKPAAKQPDTKTSKQPPEIDYSGQPSLGNSNAPVKIAEFGDYRCIYCKQFEETIFPKLKKDYIDTGKVQFFFINYTILGEGSQLAANAGEAVYRQDPVAFWDFHKALYEAQGPEDKEWVTKDLLTSIAKKTVPSLDVKKFQASLDNRAYQSDVVSDYKMGQKLGIQGTPALFVNGQTVSPLDYGAIQAAIDKANKGDSSGNGE